MRYSEDWERERERKRKRNDSMVMREVTKDEIEKLVKASSSEHRCVSFYFPTVRGGKEAQQNPLRLRNLYRQAHSQLQEVGLKEEEAKKSLKPVASLIDDQDFWLHPTDGAAVFLAPDVFHTIKLPYSVSEILTVSDSFHLKPLLPMLEENVGFYVLALSQNAVQLYQADRYAIEEIPLENVPKSMEEALRFDQYEPSRQMHSGAPGSDGSLTGVRHGQGPGGEDEKKNLRQFFHQVDRGLNAELTNKNLPLLVAAVDYYLPIFRDVSAYPRVFDTVIPGNPEHKTVDELRDEGWQRVEKHFDKELASIEETVKDGMATGKGSNDLESVVPAAYHGRVATCFVALGIQQWGRYDEEEGHVTFVDREEPGVKDLLDSVAVHTWLHRGHVYPVKPENVPGGGKVAALYRY